VKKKTDEALNMAAGVLCGFLVGVLITLIFVFFAGIARFTSGFFNVEPLRLSTTELIKEIKADNGTIPDSAYEIYYHNNKGGRDLMRWVSYRASDRDIQNFLNEMQGRASDTKFGWPPAPMAHLSEEEVEGKTSRYEDWWPTSPVGLKVIYGERFIVGYDPLSHRIYYYQYTI
jgi:hypothetical protein